MSRSVRRQTATEKARVALAQDRGGWHGRWRGPPLPLAEDDENDDAEDRLNRCSRYWMRRWGWRHPRPVAHGILDFLLYDGEDLDDRYADWILAVPTNPAEPLVRSPRSLRGPRGDPAPSPRGSSTSASSVGGRSCSPGCRCDAPSGNVTRPGRVGPAVVVSGASNLGSRVPRNAPVPPSWVPTPTTGARGWGAASRVAVPH